MILQGDRSVGEFYSVPCGAAGEELRIFSVMSWCTAREKVVATAVQVDMRDTAFVQMYSVWSRGAGDPPSRLTCYIVDEPMPTTVWELAGRWSMSRQSLRKWELADSDVVGGVYLVNSVGGCRAGTRCVFAGVPLALDVGSASRQRLAMCR